MFFFLVFNLHFLFYITFFSAKILLCSSSSFVQYTDFFSYFLRKSKTLHSSSVEHKKLLICNCVLARETQVFEIIPSPLLTLLSVYLLDCSGGCKVLLHLRRPFRFTQRGHKCGHRYYEQFPFGLAAAFHHCLKMCLCCYPSKGQFQSVREKRKSNKLVQNEVLESTKGPGGAGHGKLNLIQQCPGNQGLTSRAGAVLGAKI